MKFNVIGTREGFFERKETKERAYYVTLYCTRKVPDVKGMSCEQVQVYSRAGADDNYERARAIQVGDLVNIDYNNRGYIDGIEILNLEQKSQVPGK